MATIHLYSSFDSNRLRFTCQWVFQEVFKQDFLIHKSKETFIESSGIKINYSQESIEQSWTISPKGLLAEENIKKDPYSEIEIDELKKWLNAPSELTFDFLSLIFYYLSRYEEYGDENKDSHNRFQYKNSFNATLGIRDVPILDMVIFHVYQRLQLQFATGFHWEPEFKISKTIDVDMIYKYKGRSFLRNLGGISRDIIQGQIQEIKERILVLANKKGDPFFVFNQIKPFEQAEVELMYFIHCGDYGKYDKQVGLDSKEFHQFINDKTKNISIGLHPSYNSNDSLVKLSKEKSTLERLTGEKCTKSRQHFLKMSLPDTYRNLIQIGIKEDYTMGYAEEIGFRAGTSRSFYFFDLIENKTTSLIVHPFCAMDVSLKRYLKLNINESKAQLKTLKEWISNYGGVYCTIFHNESLSDQGEWKGWKVLFTQN